MLFAEAAEGGGDIGLPAAGRKVRWEERIIYGIFFEGSSMLIGRPRALRRLAQKNGI